MPRMIAYETYEALKDAGASDEAARRGGAEIGDPFVSLEATKVRLNVLIGVVMAGMGIIIAGIFQIVLRLGSLTPGGAQ